MFYRGLIKIICNQFSCSQLFSSYKFPYGSVVPVRGISLLGKKKKPKAPKKPKCPDVVCNRKPPPKKSFWKRLFGSEEVKKKKLPPLESCKVRQARKLLEDPDLSEIEGKPYRTCGEAFVIQRDKIPEDKYESSREDKILRKIETHPSLKRFVEDPMPPYKSVEQRLLDLTERRLHPLYKKYCSMTKKPPKSLTPPKRLYKTRSGPVSTDEIPKRLKFNKELMEKKNLFADFKRVEPPRQMVAKLVEMEKNTSAAYWGQRKKEGKKKQNKSACPED